MSTWVPTYENVSGNFMPQELMGNNFTSIDELFNIIRQAKFWRGCEILKMIFYFKILK